VPDANALLARRWFDVVNEAARSRVFPEAEAEHLVDPDIRLDLSRNVFNPGVHIGVDGLRQVFEGIWEVWEHVEFVPLEVVPGDGGQVAVRVEVRARARTGVEFAVEEGTRLTIRDNRIAECVTRMEWREALEGTRMTTTE
jgi:hypothetical protein